MNDFGAAVQKAAANGAALAAVERLYQTIAAEIAARNPVCILSGRCCHFETWGHRLFVTTLEFAAFSAQGPIAAPPNWNGEGCPFQSRKLCTAHTRRPMGCRLYFCDETSTDWQRAQYERFHGTLKSLHAEFAIPYFYQEWRHALAQAGQHRDASAP